MVPTTRADHRFPPGTIVYSYVRFSAAGSQARGHSVQRQVELSERWAASHGLKIDTSLRLSDLGKSAYKGQHLAPGGALGLFLKAVDDGRVKRGSILAVEAIDRLSRQTVRVAFAQLSALVEKGITVVTTTDGRVLDSESLDTNFADLFISLASMFQAWESSALKSKRLLASHQNKRLLAVEQKKPLGAMTVSWLRLDRAAGKYVVIPENAKVVKRIFALTVERGLGRQAIAKTLNVEGVPCISWKQAKTWHSSLVSRILGNPAVIGDLRLKGGVVAEGIFPPVISRSTWLAAQSRARSRRFATGPRGKTRNIWGGLVKCSCGASMVVRNKGRAKMGSYLLCSRAIGGRCRYRGWSLRRLEPLLLHLLKRALPWSRLLGETRSQAQEQLAALHEQVAALTLERDAVQVRITRVEQAILDGTGESRTLRSRLDALETQAATLENQWRSARECAQDAQVSVKTAREAVQRHRDVFQQWQSGGLRDAESRDRLSVTLHDVLTKVILHAPPAGRGRPTKQETRKVTLIFAVTGEDVDFRLSSDLLTAVDPDGGEVLVKLDG